MLYGTTTNPFQPKYFTAKSRTIQGNPAWSDGIAATGCGLAFCQIEKVSRDRIGAMSIVAVTEPAGQPMPLTTPQLFANHGGAAGYRRKKTNAEYVIRQSASVNCQKRSFFVTQSRNAKMQGNAKCIE